MEFYHRNGTQIWSPLHWRWLGWFRMDKTEDLETKYARYRDYTGHPIKHTYPYMCVSMLLYFTPHKVSIVSRTNVRSRNGCCWPRMLTKYLYCQSQYPKPLIWRGSHSLSSAIRAHGMQSRGRGFESYQGCAIFHVTKFRLFQEQLFTVETLVFTSAYWHFVCLPLQTKYIHTYLYIQIYIYVLKVCVIGTYNHMMVHVLGKQSWRAEIKLTSTEPHS